MKDSDTYKMVSQSFKQLNKLRKASHGLSQAEISQAAQSYGEFLQAKATLLEEERERDTHQRGTEEHTASQKSCGLAERARSDAAANWRTELGQLKARHPKLKDSIVDALSVGDCEIKNATTSMLQFLADPEAATTQDGGESMQQGMDGQTSKGKHVI
jgi:hypothetical protein